ncbi:hypothetical protein Avbf_13002, partial [Armadillidium vulgare]
VRQRIRQSQGQSFTGKAEADRRGIEWRSCNEVMCSFTEYQVDAGGKLCSYCGHVPQFIGEDIEW